MLTEKHLPEEERYFLLHPENESFFSKEALLMNFVYPYAFYLLWAIIYSLINFTICAKKIRERRYDTLYRYFETIGWSKKIMARAGKFAPIVFMAFHFAFFSIGHFIAIISFYSLWMHQILMMVWVLSCIYNGSCYYVRFFEYTKKLSQLQKTKMAVNTPTVNTSTASSKKEN